MQTFEEMFIIGFFETCVSIFGPNVANPTLKYVAYKDAEEGDPIHQAIKQHKEQQGKKTYDKLPVLPLLEDPSLEEHLPPRKS